MNNTTLVRPCACRCRRPAGRADTRALRGVDAGVIALLTYLFSEVFDGRNAHLADGVQRALGRQPRDFRDYARDAAARGVWDLAHAGAA
jgi:hypothetical protein